MPTFPGKDGKPSFSMNPQVGKAMSGTAPGMPPPTQTDGGQSDDHVEIHHGGHPQGTPPPSNMTKYHTIAAHSDGSAPEIMNHDDYSSADQHMQQCMGEAADDGQSDMMNMDMGSDNGDE